MLSHSGHDTTIMPLLATLGLDLEWWPDYASNIVFELWKEGLNSDRYLVRVLHDRKPVALGPNQGAAFHVIANWAQISLCDVKACLHVGSWRRAQLWLDEGLTVFGQLLANSASSGNPGYCTQLQSIHMIWKHVSCDNPSPLRRYENLGVAMLFKRENLSGISSTLMEKATLGNQNSRTCWKACSAIHVVVARYVVSFRRGETTSLGDSSRLLQKPGCFRPIACVDCAVPW
jgi:Histidine phosphatase superfamily (branch 2)